MASNRNETAFLSVPAAAIVLDLTLPAPNSTPVAQEGLASPCDV